MKDGAKQKNEKRDSKSAYNTVKTIDLSFQPTGSGKCTLTHCRRWRFILWSQEPTERGFPFENQKEKKKTQKR